MVMVFGGGLTAPYFAMSGQTILPLCVKLNPSSFCRALSSPALSKNTVTNFADVGEADSTGILSLLKRTSKAVQA